MRLVWRYWILALALLALPAAPVHAQGTTPQTVTITSSPGTPSPFPVYVGDILLGIFSTSSSGLPIVHSSLTPTICGIGADNRTIFFNHVGTCTLEASQAGNATYAAASSQTTFSIGQGIDVVTANISDIALDRIPYQINATLLSGLTPQFTSQPSASNCTVSTSGQVSASTIGQCNVAISSPGNADFSPGSPTTVSFTIKSGQAVITLRPPPNSATNFPPPVLNATIAPIIPGSIVTVFYLTNTPEVCQVTYYGGYVSWTPGPQGFPLGGVCSISANQAFEFQNSGDPVIVADANPVTVTFKVQNSLNEIAFPVMPNTALNQTPPVPAAITSSGLPVTYTSLTTSTCAVTPLGVISFLQPVVGQPAPVGTCTLQADQAGNASTGPALSATRSFEVTTEANFLTLSFPVTSVTLGGPSLTADVTATTTTTSNPPIGVDLTSSTPTICEALPGNVIRARAVGRCTILANAIASGLYSPAAEVRASFNVVGAPNTINFPALANTEISLPGPLLLATANASPIIYSSNTKSVCTVNPTTNEISLLAYGSCAITATQLGDSTHAAASPVLQRFLVEPVITPGVNTIIFPALPDTQFSDPPPFPGAVATSDLLPTYAVTAPAANYTCTVTSSGVITFLSAGPCSITASQAGNASFPAATPVTQAFNILGIPNAITFHKPADTAFSNPPPVLSAVATSHQPVTFSVTLPDSGACSVTPAGVITFINSGVCSITASQAAIGQYLAAAPVVQEFIILGSGNIITFPALPNTPITAPPPTPAATSNLSLPVSYASNSTSICTVAAGVIAFVTPGTCSITATQAGTGNHGAAEPVTRAFYIDLGANVITFNPFTPPSYALSDPAPVVSATASSGLTVSYESNSLSVCTVTPAGVITMVASGTCSITALQAGNATYAAAEPVTQAFAVGQGTNTITFPALASVSMPGPAPVPAATASSGLPVTYTSNPATVCTVSAGGGITLVAPGTCTITASQPGDASHVAATPQNQAFMIAAVTNVITFAAPPSTQFGSAPPALGATASSGLSVEYTSNSTTVCTVTLEGVLTLVSAGTCSITASQPGDATFAAAAQVTRTFSITPASNTINFPQPPDVLLSSGSLTVPAVATSLQPVSFAASPSSVCSVSAAGVVSLISAGSCSVTASQAASATYAAAAPVARSFNVGAATSTISFQLPPSTPFTSPPPGLNAISSTGFPVVYTSNTTSVCTANTTTASVTFVSGGICSITAAQSGGPPSAQPQPVTQVFTITPGTNVITFPQPANTPFANAPPALAATASSGLPVSYASATRNVCTVTSAGALTFVSGGTCSITASRTGTASYAAAIPATVSFQVTASSNVITFVTPATIPFSGLPLVLAGTASSGQPVGYASSTPTICTAATTGTVRLVKTGACTITASQAATSSFAAATPVTRTITVLIGSNVITFPALPSAPLSNDILVLTATASSNLPVVYTSSTKTVCTVSPGGAVKLLKRGTCTITASQPGSTQYVAATPIRRSFTITARVTALVASAQKTVASPQTAKAVQTAAPSSVADEADQSAEVQASQLKLTASTLTPEIGQIVTLVATLESTPTGGTVTFSDGNAALCSDVVMNATAASCTIPFAKEGVHRVTAAYSGHEKLAASISAPVAITLKNDPIATARAISGFFGRRNNLIQSSAPDTRRQIDRLGEARGASSGSPAGGQFANSAPQVTAARSAALSGFSAAAHSQTSSKSKRGRWGVLSALEPSDDTRDVGLSSPFDKESAEEKPNHVPLPVNITGSTEGRMTFGFSTSLREVRNRAAQADVQKLGVFDQGNLAQKSQFNPFDVWVAGTYTSFETANSGINQDGHFGLISSGADYVVNSNILIGAMVQFDDMSQDATLTAGSADGNGWMAGPYATVRLSDNVFWQSRAAWGTSSNSISPNQTDRSSFDSERWLASTKLSGQWMVGGLTIKPEASVSYLEDVSDSFVDKSGQLIPQVSTSLGQVKVGPDFSYSLGLGGYTVQPHAGVELIWNFADDATAAGLGDLVDGSGGTSPVRGRAVAGVRIVGPDGISIDAQSGYDGIGSGDYKAISGSASVRVPLN